MNYKDRIVSNPKIMLGKPVIKGTRMTVEQILTKIAGGYSIEELVTNYPHLTKEDILACIDYAVSVMRSEDSLEVA